MTTAETTTRQHPFEASGLGLAPFRATGFSTKVCGGESNNGFSSGYPGQPAGTCDHCGTGIKYCVHVVSSDGKKFIVGMDCALKLDRDSNAKFVAVVKTEKQKLQAEQRKATTAKRLVKESERIAAAFKVYDDSRAMQAAFAAAEHPLKFAGLTKMDYVNYMRNKAGHSGLLRVAALIEKGI